MRRLTRRWAWLNGIGMGLLALAAACAPLAPGGQAPEATVAPTEAAPATETLPTQTAPPGPTDTPRPTPTVIAVATTTPAPGALDLDWTSTSPDGQWTATALTGNLFEGESYYVRLRVEGSTGAQVWVPVDEWRPMGLGYTTLGLLQWSADGQRLYFTNVPHPDGCSLYVNGGDVQVLDLRTGQVTELMPEQGLWLALSPDETRLAYIGYGMRGLVIRDLATGQEQSVALERPVPDAPLGAMVWAPDGSALALTASHDVCGIEGTTSILHVDLATGEVRTLVDADARGLTTVAWPDELGQVVLHDANGVEWWVDVESGQLAAPDMADAGSVVWTETSPDGQWIARVEGTGADGSSGLYRVRLTLTSADGVRTWRVVDEERAAGLGATTPQGLHWSADGTRFYFTNVPSVEGCAWFVNGTDLHRVDLTTGRVTELLPESGLALALSPDETRVAYIGYGERGMVVRDLVIAAEQPMNIAVGPEAPTITQMVWSPDSERLALTFVDKACVDLEPSRYLTAIVDADTGEARTLLDNDPRLLTIVEWTEPGQVKLMDWDGGLWWLDVESGEVTPA